MDKIQKGFWEGFNEIRTIYQSINVASMIMDSLA